MTSIEWLAYKCREPTCAIIVGRRRREPPEECPVCEGTMFVHVEGFL